MQVAAVPEGLAAMPPGACLAAVLGSIEVTAVPNGRMLEVLRAQYRQLCHEQARMIAAIAEVDRCAGGADPGRVDRRAASVPYASDETRAALRWSRSAADAEHELAETLVHAMPAVFTSWLAGDIDRPRVRIFERYLFGLTPEQVTGICAVAVPRAPRLTTGQLAVLLRRMVIAVDPNAAVRWYRKGIRERNVTAVLDTDGTVIISANGLPADEAEAACVRLQELAATAKRAGHPGLIGQIRCDLFLGLLDGRFHHMTREQIVAALIACYRETGPAGPPASTRAGQAASGRTPATPEPPEDPQHDRDAGESRRNGPGDAEPDRRGPDSDAPDSDAPDSDAPDDDAPDDTRPDDTRPDDTRPDDGGPGGGSGAEPARPAGGMRCARGGAAPDERVGIEIRIGLATLLGRDQHPAEIPGLGFLVAPDARHRVATAGRAEWRYAIVDPDGHLLHCGLTRRRPRFIARTGPRGGIVELHVPLALLRNLTESGAAGDEWAGVLADIAEQYRSRDSRDHELDARRDARLPATALRRHVELRDRTCSFVGCRRAATGSELDHTHEHSRGGATVRANLGPTCGHDHDLKHEGAWTLSQPHPGRFVWRSPLGGVYETRGEPFLPAMPDPRPAELPPNFDLCGRVDEGPILRPPQPAPPRPPPAPGAPQNDPDEPPF